MSVTTATFEGFMVRPTCSNSEGSAVHFSNVEWPSEDCFWGSLNVIFNIHMHNSHKSYKCYCGGWVLLCLIIPWYVILDTKWKCFRRWQICTEQEADAWRQRIIKSRPTDWQKWWWLTRNCYCTLAAHFKIKFSILVFSNIESYIIILNNGHMFDIQ